MQILRIEHVQLAMPSGGEAKARTFFVELLGMREVSKPQALANRGGCWFEAGAVHLHLGVEENFLPARKAHPAFVVSDLTRLRQRLEVNGYNCQDDVAIQGFKRCFVADPFGNRIELMQAL
ncbi:VOC family protein [Polycladidibacter stylochi]|uniref:VOC family protein n=1 Tax=Polycladidibacter stylochi TaxID=1807766 RepID=UPI00082E828A|nr:VOC family protein [Pseudovibrio stylochi]